MNFLANENFPLDAVEILRQAGHDVAWVRSDAPGSTDPQVLAWAVREKRIVLTFDKDFGDLAFRAGLPGGCGIILFRLGAATSAQLAEQVVSSITARDDWAGHFSVVEPGRIRMRTLPGSTPP